MRPPFSLLLRRLSVVALVPRHEASLWRFSLPLELKWPLRCFDESQSRSRPYSTATGKKGKAAPLQERRMIDKLRIHAKGGDGGNGCWSIRRSRTDWRGKPDGGNGGRGGDVILECSSVVWDFSNLQNHLNAKKGGHGIAKKQIGRCGSNKVVQVPVGTVIHLIKGEVIPVVEKVSSKSLQPWEVAEIDESEHSMVDKDTVDGGDCGTKSIRTHVADDPPSIRRDNIRENNVEEARNSQDLLELEPPEEDSVQYEVAELTEPNQRIIIACGGAGGLGNAYFGKVPNPRSKAKCRELTSNFQSTEGYLDDAQSSLSAGSPGTESILILELKSIADVGLVGMPNAGKSTLLGAISRAKPAVGDYAFTTLRPNIGKLNYGDFFSVSVADIPGIIKGAHQNRGLGHFFLRHIERTKVLAYVVDLAAALDGRGGIPPWEQLRDLQLELEHHQKGLSNRPSLVVANKIDEDGAEIVLEELKQHVQGVPIFPVCAILEEGISELKAGLRSLMDGGEFPALTLANIDSPSLG